MTPMDSSGSTSQSEAKGQVTTILRRDRYDGSSGRAHIKSSAVSRRESNCQFPQMKEFTHFHYDQVEFGTVKLEIDSSSKTEAPTSLIAVQVMSQERFWTVHRGLEHFLTLDVYLHRCIYDRQISQLPDISQCLHLDEQGQLNMLTIYLSRLSDLIGVSGSMVNCGTVLNFFELDNHGRRLMAAEDSAINIPAIAAAHCVQRYIAQASDELSLEVGDMVSVIDMPPAEDTNWWRGKKNFEVGLFPAECVEVIGGRTLPQQLGSTEQVKPVLRRRGKIISFLRMFFSNRPQRSALKQSGIVKERVFGCDLGEHLLNSGLQVPYVLTNCIEFVETFGMTDGIYRLTGVTSNVQKLRFSFDEGTIIDLSQQEYLSDLHSVTAVLKMYFRELPNPLLTYHLYGDFATTLHYKDEERLRRMQEVVRRLPPPNYRTAKRLFMHLHKMAQNFTITNMDTRNLAIVWAPNLMRCKALDNAGSNVSGMSVLNSVSLQATVTEFMISHADLIFTDDQAPTTSEGGSGASRKPRPTSMVLSAPGRLLSLAEAQGRLLQLQGKTGVRPVEIASIAMNVNPVYHTIIEFPGERRRVRSGNAKGKEKAVMAAAASWKAIFSKHAGAIGLKSRHKEKTKAAEDGTESEDDQQLSEIGHLSRQTQQGSLPSVKKAVDDEPVSAEGRRVRLLSERSLLEDSDDNPGPRSAPPSHAPESNLVRSASHESFFDGDMASVGTPGVVFRPAYKESTAHDLVQPLPSATWRRTKFHSKSPPPASQQRIPYVPTPNIGGQSDRVEPYMLQRSPSVGRRSVICLSPDNEVSERSQPLSAAGAVPPAGLPAHDEPQCRSGCSSNSIALMASGPSTSDGTSVSSVSRSRRPAAAELGRAGSLDNLAVAAVTTNVAGEDSQIMESTSGSSEQLRELMSHWESSDRLLVATQGLSARTHRLPQAALHDRLSPPAPSPRAFASQSDAVPSDVLAVPWRLQPASTAGTNAADTDSCAAVGYAAAQQRPPTTESHGDGTIPESASVPPSSGLLLTANKSDTRGDGLDDKSSSDFCSGSSSSGCGNGAAVCNVGSNNRSTSSPRASVSSGGSTCSSSSSGSDSSAGVRWRRKHQQVVPSSSDAAADSLSGSATGASLEGASQPAVPSCGRPSELEECGSAALDDDASRSNDGYGEPPVDAITLHFCCGSSAIVSAAVASRDPEAAAAAAIDLADHAESPCAPSMPSAAAAATVHAPLLRSQPHPVPSLPVDSNRNCSNSSEYCSDASALLSDASILPSAAYRPASPLPLQLPDSSDSPAAPVESEVQTFVANSEAADSDSAAATSACRDLRAVAAVAPEMDALREADATSAAASPTVAQLAFQYETGTARRETVLAFSLPPAAGAGVSPLDPLTSYQPAASSHTVEPPSSSMAETPRLQQQQRECYDTDEGPPPPNAAVAAADGDSSCSGSTSRGIGKPPRPQPRLSLRLSHATSGSDAAAAAPASPRLFAHSQQRRAVLPPPPAGLPSPSESTLADHVQVQPPAAASAAMVNGKAIAANRASAAVSPGQCAFRWIGSPAAMELPSPASAAVAVPPPLPNFVRLDESSSPSDATSRHPLAADAGTASDAVPARDASSAGARTSALYAAVILEATRPVAASPSPAVTLASPDITDAFMAFSGV